MNEKLSNTRRDSLLIKNYKNPKKITKRDQKLIW